MLHYDETADTFINAIKMNLFSYYKFENPMLNTIFTTCLFTLVGLIVKWITEMRFINNKNGLSWNDVFVGLFYKRNQITIEGKLCCTNSIYSSAKMTELFSEQFKSVWKHIIHNIYENKSINEIREMISFDTKYDWESNSESSKENGLFVVSQQRKFLFCEKLGIYAYTRFNTMESRDEKTDKSSFNTEIIEVVLYSYKSSVSEIKDYIELIKQSYLEKLQKSRDNKRFIYTLIKTKYEDSRFECWDEDLFTSTRSFNNMFFEKKQNILDQINFFINNRNWYVEKGIPYTLGIGLYGPPGTGKTSFIKALAKHTERHIISLSLKTIKTRRQLMEFFFEDRYNTDNKKHSIGFDNKIIVIEDIDAQGDIVLDRTNKKSSNQNSNKKLDTLLNCLIEGNNSDDNNEKEKVSKDSTVSKTYSSANNFLKQDDDSITLDDILTLWDGIKETDGRILIISSNHYDKLDPALRRPGRIDINLEMKLVSRNIFQEIYTHLYGNMMIEKNIKKIKDYFHSPAEIVNIFTCYKQDEEGFYNAILKKQVEYTKNPQKQKSNKLKKTKLIIDENLHEKPKTENVIASTILVPQVSDDL